MPLTADWSIRAELVPLFEAAKLSGEGQTSIQQLYRNGDLGPAPDVRVTVAAIPIYHLAALMIARAAAKRGFSFQRLGEVFPEIVGAAYVQFQLAEIKAGRCDQRGGTPTLNTQLWGILHGDNARSELEQRLPGGPVATKRFVCFIGSDTFAYDDLGELPQQPDSDQIIDTWSIATHMQHGLRGTFLATFIP